MIRQMILIALTPAFGGEERQIGLNYEYIVSMRVENEATRIGMVNGESFVVQETPEEIVQMLKTALNNQ